MYFTVGALNLLYQFWVHTRHLPKLGWLEWVFITPSNHRVHHARNPRYVDRNYGGVFIVWDRVFGTFQEELHEEPVEFGISKPLASWNPLRANLHIFQKMLSECRRTGSLRDKPTPCLTDRGRRERRENHGRGQPDDNRKQHEAAMPLGALAADDKCL